MYTQDVGLLDVMNTFPTTPVDQDFGKLALANFFIVTC